MVRCKSTAILSVHGAYLATINAVLVGFNRIPMPTGVQLSESDLDKLGGTLLLIIGSAIDDEFNRMVMELEVLMVRSIYKLDLKRLKTSYLSKLLAGRKVRKIEKILYQKFLLGAYVPLTIPLLITLFESYMGIEISEEEAIAYYQKTSTSHYEDKYTSFL